MTRALFLAAAILPIVLAVPISAGEPNAAAGRPNIVLIVADDQSYRDFGFLGNDRVHTPRIDQLAARSARFPHGYVPTSVCRPSLATLLTGLYPHQHGLHFNHPPPGLRAMQSLTAAEYHRTRATSDPYIERVPTLPRLLARHGYACLQTGKHWEGNFRTAGFTHGMTTGLPATPRDAEHGTRQLANGEWVAHGNGDAGLAIGRDTLQPIRDFVAEHAGRRPFLVWYAPFLPHAPFNAPPRFRDLYEGSDVPPHLLPYYAEIARFDETVGELLDVLAAHDQLANTLIVMVSDNGFRPQEANPERQNDRSKLSHFEDGLRTPILVRWDGHTQSGEHTALVQTVDIVPTVLHAAGLADEITPRMRGIELLTAASGGTPLSDRPAFGAIYPNDATELGRPSRHVRGRWIREGRFKLVVPGPTKPPIPTSLYDLGHDPEELVNLAADPQHADRIARMTRTLDAWWSGEDDAAVTNLEAQR
jgi:arylsulfatase A